jgi:hypothetical protein
MKFVEVILKNSQIKEAKLFGPSKKASESPETGVVIQNPAAYHVIKDCATLANKYLPHYVFGHYANPFEVLKGKFTKLDVTEFIEKANSDIVLYQLLLLIIEKIKKTLNISTTNDNTTPILQTNTDDPYGEYESYANITLDSKPLDNITLICKAFEVR